MVANPDLLPAGADWTKATWDIPASNQQELWDYLASFQMTVEHFRTLPVYKMNAPTMPWLAKVQSPREVAENG